MAPSHYVIVVAGGSGIRMGSEIPKQFLEIQGKPIIVHTIEKFLSYNPAISVVVALPSDHLATWSEIKQRHFGKVEIKEVTGGDARFDSVKNALNVISGEGLVAVHDAVRPCVSVTDIAKSFELAKTKKAVILVVPLKESIREFAADGSSEARDRNLFRSVQTPQVFDLALLREVYQQSFQSHFTDDASVAEAMGVSIHTLEGSPHNIKITTPDDLVVAESLLTQN